VKIPSQDTGRSGVFARVMAKDAGWELLNMNALRLTRGEKYASLTRGFEHVTVILGGTCHIRTSRGDFPDLGERENVFSGKASALYLPRDTGFEIEAVGDLEVACCWVPTDQDHEPRRVDPKDCAVEIRGGGYATRQIHSILPPGFPCHRLVCVEVYTPPGSWSSYPPHKHDEHRVGPDGTLLEADLEEIYFYKTDRPEGFAYQRVYNERFDELHLCRNHDVVLVPEGYHPVVSGPGTTTYYLNFLAGSAQSLANSDDPAYAWFKNAWGPPDPRLPLEGL